MWNNYLNIPVMSWLGQFTAVSAPLNQIVHYMAGSHLLKGLPMMGMLWFYWLKENKDTTNTRRIIIATLIGTLFAVLIARATNTFGPYQPRPFSNPELLYHFYAGLPPRETQALYLWSSFPSDHAALFYSLATGIFLISRSVGSFLFVYVTIFIALPRIYLGLHYPTDILAGGILAVACVGLCTRKFITNIYDVQYTTLLNKYPAAFQAILFMASAEISMLFIDLRSLVHGIVKYFPYH
ncbi:MAG: phosphatase PAP2 family protein [Formivibrio sp.]|nr:phosphatase PAP2 family protein [Formivibrio sp.]